MRKRLVIVIKLGTSSIVDEHTHEPLLSNLSIIVETACALRKDGHKVVIVSSGAIGLALGHRNLPNRPKHLPAVQALAAIGQCKLMALWDQLFMHRRQSVAQILLTRSDISDRTQYLNAQNTFTELLQMGTIPVVNENDTLSVAEIKFGDNDTLSAFTAAMVQADYLFLMTDVPCLYDKNPRTHKDAKPIEVVENISDVQADVSSAGSAVGTGGMSTKIVAARLATSAGVITVICKSSEPGNIANILRWSEAHRAGRSRKDVTAGSSVSSRTDEDRSSRSQHEAAVSTIAINEDDFRKKATINDRAQNSTLSTSLNPTGQSKPTVVAGSSTSSSPSSPNSAPSPTVSPSTNTPTYPPLHTRFLPINKPVRDRYLWILHGLTPHGTLLIDPGAYRAIKKRAGLLPVGVRACTGNFAQQECVRIVVPDHTSEGAGQAGDHAEEIVVGSWRSEKGEVAGADRGSTPGDTHGGSGNIQGLEVGRALVSYSSSEIRLIMGLNSSQILPTLGYADGEYVALRENIAFF